jgi:hypothetical protein
MAMRELDVGLALWARAFGVSESTVSRIKRPPPPAPARAPRILDESSVACARDIVRRTHGLVGARQLSRACRIPRRTCAAIKRDEMCRLERERRTRCTRVTVAAPAVIRGFDAMHVNALDGKAYWLVAGDAAIPFRTSITTVPVYDAAQVIAALAADFEMHDPPLVLRLDRIACQRTREVDELLAHYGVLALHGPPRYPRYYGQLERQNREHSEWHKHLEPVTMAVLAEAAQEMRTALNTLWPRPTLDGWTAQQAWDRRIRIDVDRVELRLEVQAHRVELEAAGTETLRAQRIATETALVARGLLTFTPGGWR